MTILVNDGGIAMTNSYLLADEQAGQAVIIDAPNDTAAPLLDEAGKRGWEVVALWATHGHFDHIADHKVVTDRFPNARVLIHAGDAPKLRDPRSSMFVLPFVIPPREPDGLLEDGQMLTVGTLQFQVISTPGHCPGHVVFYCKEQKVLFGGDLIIMGAVGRTDLPDSRHSQLEASIRKVMKLPPDTRLLPGHGGSSLLSDEARNNPYVRQAMGEE